MKNFDLSWFTTIPGLFITGGVILLIIALVILIITGKKTKKEKEAQSADSNMQGGVQPVPAMNANVGVPTMNAPVTPNPMMGVNTAPTVAPTINTQPVMPNNDSMVDVNSQMPEVNMNVNPNVTGNEVLGMPTDIPNVVDPMAVPMNDFNATNVNNNLNMVQDNTYNSNVVETFNNEPTPVVPVDAVSVAPVEEIAVAPVESISTPVESVPVAPIEMGSVMPETVTVNSPVTEPAPIVDVPLVNDTTPIVDNSLVNQNVGDTINQSFVQDVQEMPTAVQDVPTYPTPEPIVTEPVVVPEPAVQPVIYGGANPTVSSINVNQDTNHQIYGGADPLQNTQPIPTVAPVEPVVVQNPEPVMVTPEVLSQQVPVSNPVPEVLGTPDMQQNPVIPPQQ